jgi:hypothetical protein
MKSSLLATAFFTSTSNEIALVAGCAAILGIAILSLLVFSQAREIRRLREWAGRAPERAVELEQRVSQAAAVRVPQPAPTAQNVQGVRPVPRTEPIHSRPAVASAGGVTATRVAAPAALAAPAQPVASPAGAQALTAAGAVAPPLPGAVQPAPAPPPPTGQPATAAAAGAVAPPAPGAPATEPKPIPWQQPAPAQGSNGAPPVPVPAPGGNLPPMPPPATPAAAAPRAPNPPVPAAAPPAAPATPDAATPQRPPAPPAPTTPRRAPAPPDPRAALAGATAAAAGAQRHGNDGLSAEERLARREERPRRRIFLIAAGAVVIVALVVVLLVGGGSSPSKTASSPSHGTPGVTVTSTGGKHATSTKKKAAAAITPPAETAVTVLNGTETEGLARRIAGQLQQGGYTQAVASFNRPPGANEVTVVEYSSGQQANAEAVAHSLAVSHVQPMEQAVAVLAGSAKVVVIVGADKASTQ